MSETKNNTNYLMLRKINGRASVKINSKCYISRNIIMLSNKGLCIDGNFIINKAIDMQSLSVEIILEGSVQYIAHGTGVIIVNGPVNVLNSYGSGTLVINGDVYGRAVSCLGNVI